MDRVENKDIEKDIKRESKKVSSKSKESRNNNIIRPIHCITFIVVIILLTIAYASLATMLGVKINGPKKIDNLNWKIEWDNVKEHDGSVKAIEKATIDSDTKTKITYEVELPKPGTFYSFDADMVNRGTIDAKINDIIEKSITDRQKKYLEYSVKYKNGKTPSKNDTLNAGERRTVTVLVKFKDNLTNAADLPHESETLNLSYQIVFVEK